MSLSKGLIKADIIAARQAIEYYEEKGIKDIKNVAAYHLQQATEKLIKYQIYNSSVPVDNAKMYTHSIENLIVYGETLNIPLNVPDYIREKSISITKWEAGSRYDLSFSVRVDVLKKCLDVVSKWFSRVR